MKTPPSPSVGAADSARERPSYTLITPARDESRNLRRLARCLARQTLRPEQWVIVDNGSKDTTRRVVDELSRDHGWICLVSVPAAPGGARGGPIVRAFTAGLAELDRVPDVVVKLDADTSMPSWYFERLLSAFAADPSLGIASGSAYELEDGDWRQRHVTAGNVWGACRAYRRECLADVLPLDEQMGWDGIDTLKASLRGWRTQTILDVPFRHHRREGERDGARITAWIALGRASHYMGYRFSYVLMRAIYQAHNDLTAPALIWGYVSASLARRPRCPDLRVRAHLRSQQRFRDLPARLREARGRRESVPDLRRAEPL
jgi:biofilm PGA synthesis N-glycosyltransferase PgaC